MKRRTVKLSVFLFLLLFAVTQVTVYAEEIEEENEQIVEPDTEIIFDPDSVINKTAAKSALADMHGVFVFRSAFITQEKIVKEREKENRELIETIVLTSSRQNDDYEKWVQLVLSSDTDKYIKDTYVEKEENTLFIWIYCIILSICVLCVAIRIEAMLKKKKRAI